MIDSDARYWVSAEGDSIPLDVLEIRGALSKGEALLPHPLTESENLLSADQYLAFLAQNFFWFSCREDCGMDADPPTAPCALCRKAMSAAPRNIILLKW